MNQPNLFSLFQQSLPQDLNKVFIAGKGFDTFRYADIEPLTAKIANLFVEFDVKPGARIVAQIPKSPMAVMLYLACLRSGVVFVPLNTAYTTEELDYFLQDTAPALLICSPEKFDDLVGLIFKHGIPSALQLDETGQGTFTDAIASISDHYQGFTPAENDLSVIIYTSGTTGKPKGAMLTQANLMSNALSLYELWGWQKGDVLIHALPIFHVHGLFVALHLALLGGSTIQFLASFDAQKIIALLPKATVLMGVPTFYTRLLKQKALTVEACKNMRLFISGSAPLLPETFSLFKAQTGHTILERYGMSETGMLTSNPLKGDRIAGTVGFPLPDVAYKVCDLNLQEVAPGEIGVLQVKGPNVSPGYWRKPALEQNDKNDGYFITGDLVQADEQGRLSIVGRNSDLIISGGFNVYPKEVERILDSLEGIIESAVFGIPDEDYGEKVIAALVVSEPSFTSTSIISVLKQTLAAYKIPKSFVILEELPRNTMGKVQKSQLRSQYSTLGSS